MSIHNTFITQVSRVCGRYTYIDAVLVQNWKKANTVYSLS